MERWIRAVAVCLAVLLTWNGAAAGEKTADEIAIDHACTYFLAIDANGDGVATYVDYVYEWLRVPLCGKEGLLVRDIKRQLDILKQFVDQFPLTGEKIIESLLTGGITMDDFLDYIRAKRHQPDFKIQVAGLMTFLFKVFNYNGDEGNLDLYEFTVIYRVFNIPDPNTSFSKLDVNVDDLVSYAEACAAGENYFITATDQRSAYLIGPPSTCVEVRKRVRTWVDPIAEGRLVLSIDKFGSTRALIDLLRSDPVLNALFPNLLEELLGVGPALVSGVIGAVSDLLG